MDGLRRNKKNSPINEVGTLLLLQNHVAYLSMDKLKRGVLQPQVQCYLLVLCLKYFSILTQFQLINTQFLITNHKIAQAHRGAKQGGGSVGGSQPPLCL